MLLAARARRRLGAQLLPSVTPLGSELVAIGRLDVAVPELVAKAEATGEIEDDIRVGPRLRRAAARQRWRNCTSDWASALISKPIFSASRSKQEATGSTTSASAAVGFMNRSAWT